MNFRADKLAKTIAWLFISVILIGVIIGCGAPLAAFDPAVVEQSKDKTLPVVTITSPVSDTAYDQTVTITGEVSDDGNLLPELSYTVSDSLGSQEKTGSIVLAEIESAEGVKGSFSFNFTTSEYSSDILVEINGIDWNDNLSEPARLRLIFPGNTIPSFSTSASSKTIACSWEAVEGASSYRIYYTTDGSIPYENYGESTEILTDARGSDNPYVISGLSNGDPHVVRLMAYSSDGNSWSSELSTVIPLSQLTLRPKAIAGYEEIYLEWMDTSDYYTYEVYRAEGAAGIPVNISGAITYNSFTDTRVEEGVDYYYSVKPSIPGAELSAPAVSASFPLTSGTDRTISSVIDQANIKRSEVHGDNVIIMDRFGDVIIFDISSPDNPEFLARWENPYTYSFDSTMAVSDDFLYIGKANRIQRVDISDPANPTLIDTVEPDDTESLFSSYVAGITLRDGKLYVVLTSDISNSSPVTGAAGEGIYVYNIETDGSLTETIFNYYDLTRMIELDIDENGTGDLLLTYYDGSSDPSGILRLNPTTGLLSTFVASQSAHRYRGVVIDESRDLVLCIKGTYVSPAWVFEMEFRKLSTAALDGTDSLLIDEEYSDAYIDGDMIYLAQVYAMSALKLHGSSGTYSAQRLYEIPLQGDAAEIEQYGDYAVCGTVTGLQVINTERKNASVTLYNNPAASARAIEVAGDLVYTAESYGTGVLSIYSFMDKSNPILLGHSSSFIMSSVEQVIAAGDYVLISGISDSQAGVYVLDVSDYSDINLCGSFSAENTVAGMELLGDILFYFCNGYVEILDISIPESILRLSRIRISTERYGDVAVKGNYLFAGFNNYTPSEGLTVLDISDLSAPEILLELTAADISASTLQAGFISISEDRLYAYSNSSEILVFDISEPDNPQFLQQISNIIDGADPLFYSGMDAAGDYLFFHGWSDGDNSDDFGLHIYNTENSSVVDRIEFNELGIDDEGQIKLYGGYLYLAIGDLICLDIAP